MKPLTFLLLILPVGAAAAQNASPVALTLQQSLVTTVKEADKTVEKLVPDPKNVLPGAVLSQVVTVRNLTAKTLSGVAVKLPVPAGTFYLAPEKVGTGEVKTEYSIDGGKTFGLAPLKRKVTVTENGKSVTREVVVSPNEYNAVRWTIASLPAASETKVGFRIKVR